MDQSQVQPYRLDWARGRDEFYEAMTVEQIQSLASEYLLPGLAYKLSIYPERTDQSTAVVSKQNEED